jgi:hypothetical protein
VPKRDGEWCVVEHLPPAATDRRLSLRGRRTGPDDDEVGARALGVMAERPSY